MSNNSICDDPAFCEPLPKNEVIVMEDSESTQEAIKTIMEKEFNLQVRIAKNEEQAVILAQEQESPCCLLDIHMGKDRRQEGIDALEKIKDFNKQSFVAILTGHPSERIQKMAKNLGADLYKAKSESGLDKDIREIALQIKNRNRQLLQEKLDVVDKYRKDIINKLKKLDDIDDYINVDINITTYKKFKSDEKWFSKYAGKYVAFREGELIYSDEDKQKLFEKLKAIKDLDKPVFYTKVEEKPRIIDLPSSLWFDDL